MRPSILFAATLLVAVGMGRSGAAPLPPAGSFHGSVYQVDTVFNFVDVIMPGGTERFYAGPSTRVRVEKRKAVLIDIAMGAQVRGTYRTDAKGKRIVVTIDDLGP